MLSWVMLFHGHREGVQDLPTPPPSSALLHSYQPPALHNYQATDKYIHLYSQHVMVTHIQLAIGFSTRSIIIHCKMSVHLFIFINLVKRQGHTEG